MVDTQLDALGSETRRRIYRLLVERPTSVNDIAEKLPVSRPAVSQHLKILVEAKLARATSLGTRRVYSADPTGMSVLRDWVDEMWTVALSEFETFAREEAK